MVSRTVVCYCLECIVLGDALVDDVIRLKLEKALKKDMTREEIRAEREKKKLEEARVRIKAVQRQGKKQVTLVTGLDLFGIVNLAVCATANTIHLGIDLKKAAKTLASKFACSCTVAKNAALEDEVLIQGDVIEDVADYLVSVFPVINESQIVQEARKRK